ncbi:hypothetical protein [Candidatus Poriferisodalis sp.]|uniref:hypothetical protein n=1 Tax=Candidatus Poriferisodalis sp. TaxID=3101277 RepID=UPI003B013683
MENVGAAGSEHDLVAERHRCERWFVRRGLPHLIHDYSASADVLTRAAPFLALVVFIEFFFVFGDRWTGWAQAAVFVVGLAVMAGVVVLVNLLRGRRLWQLPDRFGIWEVLAYLVLGAVFAGLGSSDSVIVDAAFAAGLNAVLLVGAYVVTSWGLLPMVRWSVGQLWRQVGQVMTLLAKSLPILLVFSAFIFLNAEMWQVANDFTLPFFGMIAALLVAVGALFVIISVRRLAVDMARFSSWADVRSRCAETPIANLVPADDSPAPDSPPLGRRARFNVSLLLFVAQSIQIALVAVIVTCFYVLFGVFTVRESTLLQWTTLSQLTWEDSWMVSLPLWSGELLFSRQLVLVAAFIGLFSGLQFAVSVVLDSSYRSEFAEDMTDELREALAVRAVYHRTLVTDTP